MVQERKFRLGLGAAFGHHSKKAVVPRDDDSCLTGGFYISPTANQVIDTSSSFNITWDSSCISSDYVDILLYDPSAASSNIHTWGKVYNSYGTYETTLSSSWWNGTSSAQLYLNILASGTQPFQSSLPAGPVFNATVTSTSSGSTASTTDTSSYTQVDNGPSTSSSSHGISKGAIAAAVILPLLAIAGLVAFAYIRIKRGVEKEKRRRFSVAVDSRMSTINPDWASITPAGAAAAVRNSMAVDANGNRASSFSYGGLRPMSTASAMVDGGQAGIGARGLGGIGIGGTQAIQSQDEMRQVGNGRTVGTGLRNPAQTSAILAERVSRVSFAPDTRPSMDSTSRKSVASRAYHTAVVPPLPTRYDSSNGSSDGTGSGTLSPTQTQGALPLSAEDIRARINAGNDNAPVRPSMDEVMPALRMMRTNDGEELFPSPPTPGTPSHVTQFGAPVSPPAVPPSSASMGASSMSSFMPMAAASMNPDDMLRAYAGRRVASPPIPTVVTQPMPTYTGLYPTTPTEEVTRKSLAPTEGSRYSHYTGEDVYGGI